jgi:hypothetical protein
MLELNSNQLNELGEQGKYKLRLLTHLIVKDILRGVLCGNDASTIFEALRLQIINYNLVRWYGKQLPKWTNQYGKLRSNRQDLHLLESLKITNRYSL